MEFFLIWVFCGVVAAVIAGSKGRSVGGWLLLGFLLGPFGLVVALLPSIDQKAQQEAQRVGTSGNYRKCPMCAEAIRVEAVKCRYCQSDVALPRPIPAPTPEGPTPLNRLSPLETGEVEQIQRRLKRAGFSILKRLTCWEITNHAGRVVAVLSTLEKLRDFVESYQVA